MFYVAISFALVYVTLMHLDGYEWMHLDGQMDVWMHLDGQMDGWMHLDGYGWMHLDGQMEVWMHLDGASLRNHKKLFNLANFVQMSIVRFHV